MTDLAEAPGFQQEAVLPLKTMPLNAAGTTYTVLRRTGGPMEAGKLLNILKFTVKEVDPSTGELQAGQAASAACCPATTVTPCTPRKY